MAAAMRDDPQQDLAEELRQWLATPDARIAAPIAPPNEVGSGFDRLKVLRNQLLISVARFYRANPDADCSPGVLVFRTFLSDNEAGVSTVGQQTLATILSRTPRSISSATTAMVANGIIDREHPGKKEDGTDKSVAEAGKSLPIWPVVSTFLSRNTWISPALIVKAIRGMAETPEAGFLGGQNGTPEAGFHSPRKRTSRGPRKRASTNSTKYRSSYREDGALSHSQETPWSIAPHGWEPTGDLLAHVTNNFEFRPEDLRSCVERFRKAYAREKFTTAGWAKEWSDWCHGNRDFRPRKLSAKVTNGFPDGDWEQAGRAFLQYGRRGWPQSMGPPPDEPGCNMPEPILRILRQALTERKAS